MDAADFLGRGGDPGSAGAPGPPDRRGDDQRDVLLPPARRARRASTGARLLEARTRAGSDTVRVWVAACASGEEAYTLAMLASEAFAPAPPAGLDSRDRHLRERPSTRARRGRYGGRSLRALDARDARALLRPAEDGVGGRPGAAGRLVEFRRHNLVLDPAPPPGDGPFDLIACRNVLIYFDGETVERVIASLERALAPDGMLVLGAADRLCGSARGWRDSDGAGTRRKRGAEPPLAPPRGRFGARWAAIERRAEACRRGAGPRGGADGRERGRARRRGRDDRAPAARGPTRRRRVLRPRPGRARASATPRPRWARSGAPSTSIPPSAWPRSSSAAPTRSTGTGAAAERAYEQALRTLEPERRAARADPRPGGPRRRGARACAAPRSRHPRGRCGVKILIVDDSPTPRLLLRRELEALGHECLVAEDGNEALGDVPGLRRRTS